MQLAHRFFQFFKATVVGGVFVLAPIVLLVYLIGKALTMSHAAVQPLVQWLPEKTFGGISMVFLVAVAGLVAVCFLAGLLAKTAIARWLVHTIEMAILTNLPGYTLLKSLGEGMAGVEKSDERKVVLVRFDDQSQIGFLMDRLADGRLAVFVPQVPSPWSGSLHIMSADRVEPLAASMREVIEGLQRLGLGIGKSLSQDRLPRDNSGTGAAGAA